MQRCCVEAVLQPPSGPLRILTTHLEYYSQRQRAAQVRALRALQDEVAAHARADVAGNQSNAAFAAHPRPSTAILCGDFNCEPGSAEYAQMRAYPRAEVPEWRDAWEVHQPGREHAPTVGLHGAEWPGRQYCCDYIWVSEDLASRVEGVSVAADTTASDHQPVVLELRN